MNKRYSNMNPVTARGFLASALYSQKGEDGDMGASFPRSDSEDMSRGARFIPGEVTLSRRRGERVLFVQDCSCPCCWYWEFSDGSRLYHFEMGAYEEIASMNGKTWDAKDHFHGDAGPCPRCGNKQTSGLEVYKNT